MSKNSSKKSPKEPLPTDTSATARKLKIPKYRSFRLQKRLPKPDTAKVPSGFRLLRTTLGVLRRYWKLFLGIIVVYTILNILLVQGFFGIDVSGTKATIESTLSGKWSKLLSGFSVLSYVAGNSGTTASTSAYRFILTIIGSLAIIWALRQVLAANKVRIRDSFYGGMHPLVPFVLVFLVISLELIPMLLGFYLFNTAGASGGMEVILWVVVLASLSILTLYMVSSSIFSLYIVCLPGMEPVAALRSATQLVRYRRFLVIRRLLFLPLILLIAAAAIMLPVILWLTSAAAVVYFILCMAALPLIHGYLYTLYRELLHAE